MSTRVQVTFDAGRDLTIREAELLHRFMVREARRAMAEWDAEDAKKGTCLCDNEAAHVMGMCPIHRPEAFDGI